MPFHAYNDTYLNIYIPCIPQCLHFVCIKTAFHTTDFNTSQMGILPLNRAVCIPWLPECLHSKHTQMSTQRFILSQYRHHCLRWDLFLWEGFRLLSIFHAYLSVYIPNIPEHKHMILWYSFVILNGIFGGGGGDGGEFRSLSAVHGYLNACILNIPKCQHIIQQYTFYCLSHIGKKTQVADCIPCIPKCLHSKHNQMSTQHFTAVKTHLTTNPTQQLITVILPSVQTFLSILCL